MALRYNPAIWHTFGDGEPVIVCPNVSPTHLAARNTTMRDIVHKLEWRWLPAGKLKAFLAAGGDPNKKDSFGNTALAYARNGGVHPGANAPGDDFNITQLFAGARLSQAQVLWPGRGVMILPQNLWSVA